MAPSLLLLCLALLGLTAGPARAQLQCPAVCACTAATLTINCAPTPGLLDRLTFIPAGGSDTFTTLIMTDNHLSTLLPGNFSAYPALQTLVLDNNLLEGIAPGGLDSLPQLTSLSLNGNPLIDLADGVFGDLTLLEDLYIQETSLTSIAGGAFQGLTNLQRLFLDDNALSYLAVDFFTYIPQVLLSARRNSLATLPDGIFTPLDASTARLDLRDNPWSCDCRMQWIADYLDANPDVLSEDSETICLWPPVSIDQPISSVDSLSFTCYGPSLVQQPQDAYILTTTEFTLVCDVEGAPFPNVTWTKDGEPFNLTERVFMTTYNGSLHFASVELQDAGVYQCTASNSTVSVESFNATLTTDEITCFDGRLSSHETDVDCGGVFCIPCNITEGCQADTDCSGDLVCLYAHSLPSQLLYISPNDSAAFTCAPPSLPAVLLEEGLVSSLPFTFALDTASNRTSLQELLREVVAQQLSVPASAVTMTAVESVERFGPPLYLVSFDLPRTPVGAGGMAELRRQLDTGMLKATVRTTEEGRAYHIRMNLSRDVTN